MTTLTQKQLFAAVRALGLSIRCADGEYRIAHKLGHYRDALLARQESDAYYTNDRDDALATARAMAQRSTSGSWLLITDVNRVCVERGHHRHDANVYPWRCVDCGATNAKEQQS